MKGLFARAPGPFAAIIGSSSMRLALGIAGVFSLASLIAGLVSFHYMTRDMNARLEAEARQLAENLAVTYQISGLAELQAQIATNAATTRDYSNLYLFVDPTGHTVFGNFNIRKTFTGKRDLVVGKDIVLPEMTPANKGLTFKGYGLRIPAGWILTARDTQWIIETKRYLVNATILGLGAALVLSFLIAVILARLNERRINRLYQVLEDVARGNLSARFTHRMRWRDDIGRVADTINAMLDRLSVTVDSLRQVSNDVAHDLRTPLTRLRSRIEPLLQRTDMPEDALEAVLRAQQDVDAIVNTFNTILRIAQIEGGNARFHHVPVDLGRLCRSVHEMLEPVAEEMGHHFTVDCSAPAAWARGDREMLAQAIVNIVENAFRHSPRGSNIDLHVETSAEVVRLQLCDNGPGIPEQERAHVLRRFYRLEQSRNTEGSGLGLSLVDAIVRLHQGNLSLSDNNPGLCVSITLARVDPPDQNGATSDNKAQDAAGACSRNSNRTRAAD